MRTFASSLAVVVIALVCWRCDRGSAPSATVAAPAPTTPATLPASILPTGSAPAGDGTSVQLRHIQIAMIALPSGKVIACDGLVIPPKVPAFTTAVPAGRHPVILTIAALPNKDERVAYATIRFGEREPVKWEPALQPGNDPKTLKPGEAFMYGVDAGTGCFMDPAALAAYETQFSRDHSFNDKMIKELERNEHTTWSWGDLVMDPTSGANLVMFSSGFGDGAYASYFGLAADGAAACLVTDFQVVDEKAAPWRGGPGAAGAKP
jgi:hypothetical protein